MVTNRLQLPGWGEAVTWTDEQTLTLQGSRSHSAGQNLRTFVKKGQKSPSNAQLPDFFKSKININISEMCVAPLCRANSTGVDGQFVLRGIA